MSLLQKTNNRNVRLSTNISGKTEKTEDKVEAIADANKTETKQLQAFHFENLVEMMLFAKLHPDKNCTWISADEYLKEYRKGYSLVENKKFLEAVSVFDHCLELNPVGINARFEQVEALLGQYNMEKSNRNATSEVYLTMAKSKLLTMKDYLCTKREIARFYRRMGYIQTELKNYKVAVACYKHSLTFENIYTVEQEIKYIKMQGGSTILLGKPEKYIEQAGIPLLKAINLPTF